MRTVHETEALRPSDPVPKNYSSLPNKPQRLKLIVNAKPRSHTEVNDETELDDEATVYNTDNEMERLPAAPFAYPSDIQFTDEELSMPPDQLYRLLRRQVHWSEEDGVEMREEVATLEVKRKNEWLAKELLLANVMEAELANAHDRGEPYDNIQIHLKDLPQPILPMEGVQPWYRSSIEEPVPMEAEQMQPEGQRV